MKRKIVTSILVATMLVTSFVPVYAAETTIKKLPSKNDKVQEQLALEAEKRAKEDKERLDLNIFIDGKKLTFDKSENVGMPFIDSKNRTMVPVRKPVELSGNTVGWNQKMKTAVIRTKEKSVSGTVGVDSLSSKDLKTNKVSKIKMDTKAVIKDGRVYIPLRAVMESIGLKVNFDKETKTVNAIKVNNLPDGKVWQQADIDREFPELIKTLKELGTNIPNTVKVNTLKLDNSLQYKMKIVTGKPNNTKWITLYTPGSDGMVFVKDGKVVFATDDFLDNIYYYYFDLDRDRTNPKISYQGDIKDVDYMLIWEYNNPVATLVENPFKENGGTN